MLVSTPRVPGSVPRQLAAGDRGVHRRVGTSFAAASELTAYPVAGGLAAFNVLVLVAVERADAGSVGVVVGTVPIVFAIVAPLANRRRPDPRLVGAALVVAAGAAAVQGFGGSMSPAALVLALGALACEAAFSLLAAPLLPRLGAFAVSAWACLLAVPLLTVHALLTDGFAVPTAGEGAALAYLAVVVTALGFVCWYTAVHRLGTERAGLFSGVLPVSALLAAAAIGSSSLSASRLAGVLAVALGITAGLALAKPCAADRQAPDSGDPAVRALA